MASVFVLLEAFNRKEAAALGFFPCATASFLREAGIYLFSQAVSSQLSSAQVSLTSVFGMGTGGTSPSLTPANA